MSALERAVTRLVITATTVVALAAPPVVALTVLLAAGPARAEAGATSDKAGAAAAPGAAKLNDEGFAFFKDRDYRRAVEKFLQAYALEPDANLLFNIARCYDALGDTAAAAEKYRLFIAQPEADAEGKRRAQEALRLLEQKQAPAAVVPPPPAAIAPAPAAASPGPVVPAPAAPPVGARSGRTGRIALLGAGIVCTFVGTTLLVMGKQDYDRVRNAPNFGNPDGVYPMTEAETRSLIDSGQSKEIVGSVVLGVGAVALVTSVVLMARAASAPPAETPRMAFGVSPERGGANLLLQGRF